MQTERRELEVLAVGVAGGLRLIARSFTARQYEVGVRMARIRGEGQVSQVQRLVDLVGGQRRLGPGGEIPGRFRSSWSAPRAWVGPAL